MSDNVSTRIRALLAPHIVYVFLPVADAIDRFERWLRQ